MEHSRKALQVIELFSVYYIGYFNCSIVWIFLFKISQFFLLTKYNKNEKNIAADTENNEKTKKIQKLKNNDGHHEKIIQIPDTQRAEWINSIFSQLWKWDYTIDSVKKLIVEKLESKIVNKFPGGAFKLENIDLGNFSPRISGIKVYEHDADPISVDEIIVDLDVDLISNCQIKCNIMKVPAKIENLELKNGCIRVILKKNYEKVSLCFMNSPNIDFNLSAFGLDTGYIKNVILNEIILKKIKQKMLFPNLITKTFRKEEEVIQHDTTDIGDFRILPDDGLILQKNLKYLISETLQLCNSISLTTEVKINNQYKKNITMTSEIHENSTAKFLILHLIKAENLVNTDSGIKGDVSDPYARITFGDFKYKTEIIPNSLNPEWNTIFIFPISNNSNDFSNKKGFEDLDVQIFDQDKFKNDANLGNVRIDVRNLIKNGGQMKEICSELQDIKTGNILFSLKVGNIELENEKDTFKHHV